MRRFFRTICIFTTLISYGCTALTEPDNPSQPEVGNTLEEEPFRITIGLPGDGTDTRLSFSEVDFEGRKAVRTYWSEGDVIVANATPGDLNLVFDFNLVEGQNTSTGTFECNVAIDGHGPQNWSTNAWTIYFPGTKIRGEADYLTHSYVGQIQTGNGSMEHLDDYHTLRMQCTTGEYITFDSSYIELSGENLDESSCLKFNLSGLPEIVPTELVLSYSAPSGYSSSCFSTHNRLDSWWTCGVSSDNTVTSRMTLGLEGFDKCSDITAYMMMSNYPVYLQNGGTLRVTVTTDDGMRYYCDKPLSKDVTLSGGKLHTVTCKDWREGSVSAYDGFENPEDGVTVLQEASVGNGTDIIIMGDGFAEDQFGSNGTYEDLMLKAYEDFFSVEPYMTLRNYFNVYYINAVSDENHDAAPYFDSHGAQNGATNGSASTVFKTQFTPGATTITGDNSIALEYAMQAIRTKGGEGGSPCTDENEVVLRANRSLIMVMVNVQCHAGTCSMVWTNSSDYGAAYSVAFTSLGNNDIEQCRWTTIHEAGGHGFGKLADEYGGLRITSFNTAAWNNLNNLHNFGIHRNVNMYWGTEERADGWSISTEDITAENVYWSELLGSYGYESSEGLGVYRGGYTYDNLFCRPTQNSVMRSQFSDDGRFFNAISRWAIWYRLMKLTGGTDASDFKSSLDEFIAFDQTLSIDTGAATRSAVYDEGMLPLAPPVLIEAEWVDGGPYLRVL